jgi:hypothetical protein
MSIVCLVCVLPIGFAFGFLITGIDSDQACHANGEQLLLWWPYPTWGSPSARAFMALSKIEQATVKCPRCLSCTRFGCYLRIRLQPSWHGRCASRRRFEALVEPVWVISTASYYSLPSRRVDNYLQSRLCGRCLLTKMPPTSTSARGSGRASASVSRDGQLLALARCFASNLLSSMAQLLLVVCAWSHRRNSGIFAASSALLRSMVCRGRHGLALR